MRSMKARRGLRPQDDDGSGAVKRKGRVGEGERGLRHGMDNFHRHPFSLSFSALASILFSIQAILLDELLVGSLGQFLISNWPF
jgi:hypothetical protein